MAANLECLKWNKSVYKLSAEICRTKYSLALKPSCLMNLETKSVPIIKLRFLAESNKLASLESLNIIKIYDWSKPDIKISSAKYMGKGKVLNLTSNSTGHQIATCTDDGKIQLWKFKLSNCVISKELKGHFQQIRGIEFSLDNSKLVSCSNDKTFKIWDCQTMKFLASNMFHRNWVNMAKFFNQDKLVASCSRDSLIQIFDCCSGKCVMKFSLNPDYAESLALKDEYNVAVGTEQGSVRVYDLRVPKIVQVYNEHKCKINCIQYQNKTPCLISGSQDQTLNVYDTHEGRFLYSINHVDSIKTMDISLDDQLLSTASFVAKNQITIWKSDSVNVL
ncbi:POC1 centriolar protein homolog B-like [Adelges cooleyi]|uniref:POC1 centriolar protein homolog B-like n=1 Tax=Adelges cooleyi TaxID=133065 RepID=UPI00217FD077|nr:POC1 centriolar protein homolog B-like [Adelges cooleyi]